MRIVRTPEERSWYGCISNIEVIARRKESAIQSVEIESWRKALIFRETEVWLDFRERDSQHSFTRRADHESLCGRNRLVLALEVERGERWIEARGLEVRRHWRS